MNTICLVQGGGFLLGIDTGDIVSRTTAGAVSLEERARMVDLGALLSGRPGLAAAAAAPCLELRAPDETFFLLVDRIDGDAEAAAPPAPMPAACPALTARLCPQVAVCGTAAVPLLDPAQVLPVCAQLGKGSAVIAEAEPESAPAAEAQAEAAEAPASAPGAPPPEDGKEPGPEADSERKAEALSAAAEEPPPEEAPPPGPVVPAAAEEPAPLPALAMEAAAEIEQQSASDQEQQRKAAGSIDEETFKQVMAWAIGRFKQTRAGEDVRLDVEQLPAGLAERARQQGLGRNVVQYLIDQIILRCQESVQRRTSEEQHGG